MSVEGNVRLVKEAYAAFGAGDLPKLLGLMSPDILWEFPASTVIPWAGQFVGPTETARFFGAIAEHVEAEAFEPLHFVAGGDQVVVLGHERFRVKSTSRTWQCEWSHAFALGAGKITSFREYTDTAVIEAAFRTV
ncbi:MAG: nuclear transport factor 2 family protein [Candidatus Rokubacteria bacterium]|nr:nuclear transport factor 2 family protein [Candidatus Rokubacteria bacterium]